MNQLKERDGHCVSQEKSGNQLSGHCGSQWKEEPMGGVHFGRAYSYLEFSTKT